MNPVSPMRIGVFSCAVEIDESHTVAPKFSESYHASPHFSRIVRESGSHGIHQKTQNRLESRGRA